MTLDDLDYYIAGFFDAAYENLPFETVLIAEEISENGEQFFWAVQAAVRLKEICNADR